ncbi:MAG: SDR family oxidoreductase [Bacteroidales bacterium]|nr:SDR family oxidoreductase [Bacteroidales bacterium]MCF8405340.1 SDR family oxidoreductase [Bacteroidales bacterium]
MKILITGNLGYVGPGVVKEFRKNYPDAELIGFDIGYFSKFITTDKVSPEVYLNQQYYGDVRQFPEHILNGVDTVVSLAAISNDPIGNRFEETTLDVNYRAAVEIAKKAKKSGVRNYIYASSCSVYGAAGDEARNELSDVNPLTAYAKSKVNTENKLVDLASDDFKITCHRFATACGMSDRLRLDLVLNDFVTCARTSGEITILSDGTPWRPLINVLDMARAIRWSHERKPENGGNFLIVNTGSDQWNYKVVELAEKIQQINPKVKVSVNRNAAPDKRSYKVDFSLFNKLAPNHQPAFNLESSIEVLFKGLEEMNFNDKNFRNSFYMRLNVINDLLAKGIIDDKLYLL